jgi:hypothetical protein
MPVSDFNQRIQQWINERWPADNPCPLCHTASGWQASPPAQMPIRPDVVEGTPVSQAMVFVTLTFTTSASF